nr:mitochondrial ribosomal protein L4 [Hymenolepis microstoma]
MSLCSRYSNGLLRVNLPTIRSCSSRLGSSFLLRKSGDRTPDLKDIEIRDQTACKEITNPIIPRSRILSPSTTCSYRNVVPRQAWVESLDKASERYLDIVDLHPDVFATFPRLDIVQQNLYWQAHYRIVDWRCITTRADLVHRSRRKPWPQKGTGRARHGNRRTHIFKGGAQCNGPRGPESYFSILPYSVRLYGLLGMLSAKQAQGDLHITEDFRLSQDLESEANEIYNLANKRAQNRLRLTPTDPNEDVVLQRLRSLEDLTAQEPKANSLDVLTSAIAREKEESEELMDLIRGGRAAEAANLGYRAAQYLREQVDKRGWGPACLFITDVETYLDGNEETSSGLAMALACASYAHYIETDVAPESAAIQARLREGSQYAAPRSVHPGRGLTLMPVHGLNVWSLVHHDSLIISRRALDVLESRLLAAQRRVIPPGFQSASEWRPPMAGDWFVGRSHEADRSYMPNRHFSGGLGDVDELKQRLQ